MATDRSVLVLGAGGVVGNAIKDIALGEEARSDETWNFLTINDGDLTDAGETRALLEKYRPTHVINLAAKYGGLYANMKNNLHFFRYNFQMYDNVLYHCNKLGINNVYTCSSTCVFPDSDATSFDESMLHNGPPYENHMGYAYSKRMIDVLNRLYSKQYGCNYTSFIPISVYGPNDYFNIETCNVLPALIHKTYLAKHTGAPLTLFGTGAARRQFMYSLDLGRLVVWMTRDYKDSSPVIFAVNEEEEVTISELVGMIARAMDYTGPINYDTTKSDGQLKRTACNMKLRSHLPDFKFVPMEEAITKTCKWFEENYATIRK